MTLTTGRGAAARQVFQAVLIAALLTTGAGMARALEIVPSLGITKSTDTDAGDAKAFGGLALRAPLFPFLEAEAGIAYRQDSFAGGDLKVRQWPMTVSLWATPLPMVYAGGGVGWYRTTVDFASSSPFEDATSMKTGVHLGGGFDVPLTPRLGLDLGGRYIFMQGDNANVQLPTTFNPDFWTTSVGLAIRF